MTSPFQPVEFMGRIIGAFTTDGRYVSRRLNPDFPDYRIPGYWDYMDASLEFQKAAASVELEA